MRFDFDSTGDLPTGASWRGMFAWANNTKTAYVSSGHTVTMVGDRYFTKTCMATTKLVVS